MIDRPTISSLTKLVANGLMILARMQDANLRATEGLALRNEDVIHEAKRAMASAQTDMLNLALPLINQYRYYTEATTDART